MRVFSCPVRALAASVALLLVCGCGGDASSPAGPETPDESDEGPADGPGDPSSELECGQKGYPCSLSAVPIGVLERSDALGDSAVTMLGDSTLAQVATWLRAREGMAEVQSGDQAIRFRLAGGRGTWIFVEGDELDPDAGAAPPQASALDGVDTTRVDEIVGGGVKQKRALVLSPFLWSFKAYDEGSAVEAILEATRGYEGGVRFEMNADSTDTTVGPESFKGWGAYQVVHVSSHGKRTCDANGCRAAITVNTLEALAAGSGQDPAELAHSLREEGLNVTKSTEHPGVTWVSVTADFFHKNYGSGLENTLVVFNACQSFGSEATDLVDAIRGSNSVVLGWDEAVHGGEARATMLKLYSELSEGGYRAEVAYDRLGNLKTGTATQYGPAPTLILGPRPRGGDLRIRDIVTLLDPATEQELTASSVVNIDGTKNDGEPDGAPWLVRVDGMKQDEAEKATLHVTVDGVDAEPVPVASGTTKDEDQWTVSGTVPLGYDLEENKTVTFRAWVELPDEGQSDHEVAAELNGDAPLMGTTWEFVASHTTSWTGIANTPYTSTADLILTFAPGQDPNEPHPRYVITGGTVTFNWTHTYGDCSYTADPITFEITEAYANQSVLIFDTTTQPVTYRGYVSTLGPDVKSTEQCGIDGDVSTRMQGSTVSWMHLDPGDEQPVSADNRSITGRYRREVVFTYMTFIQDSQYTITRIR